LGPQVDAFTTAFERVSASLQSTVDMRLNLITNKVVGESHMTECEIVDELMKCDVHVILGHMHQGNPQWSPVELYYHLNRLNNHVGWPSGENLRCPVFQQDKYRYISKCPELTIPSLKLEFGRDWTDEILEFTSSHDEKHGWIVKLPFTTNSEGISFCKTTVDVLAAAQSKYDKFGHRIPYAILQPCLANRKEYKVVLLGGEALYVANISQHEGLGAPFSSSPHNELKLLAEQACEILESRCPGALTQQILRVDIMQSCNGLVVNEFESLEANFSSHQFERFQMLAQNFIREFWLTTIPLLVTEVIHKDDV